MTASLERPASNFKNKVLANLFEVAKSGDQNFIFLKLVSFEIFFPCRIE